MRYRALMIESRHIDRSLDKGATREDIIAKFIFTLLFQFVVDFGPNLIYHVFIDSPDGTERPSDKIKFSLNNKCKSQLGYTDPFKTVNFVLSHKSRLIQASDLLTGVVAYETNALHLARDASRHRLTLWSDMLASSRLPSFAEPTKRIPKQFQIRHFDFEKSRLTRFKTETGKDK